MPLDLAELLAGRRGPVAPHPPVAVLTVELQRGVIGDRASLPELAEAAARDGVVANTARLVEGFRARGLPVVHCTAEFRADRLGTAVNTPLHASLLRRPEHLLAGSAAAALVPELAGDARDLICARTHGVSPFTGTGLDALLTNMGVQVVVLSGVSLNLAVLGCAVEAVNLGYGAVVATDAVTGVPADYAQAVLTRSLALVAALATVDEVLGACDLAATR